MVRLCHQGLRSMMHFRFPQIQYFSRYKICSIHAFFFSLEICITTCMRNRMFSENELFNHVRHDWMLLYQYTAVACVPSAFRFSLKSPRSNLVLVRMWNRLFLLFYLFWRLHNSLIFKYLLNRSSEKRRRTLSILARIISVCSIITCSR